MIHDIRGVFEGDNFVDKFMKVACILSIDTVLQVFPNIGSKSSGWDCQKNLSINVVYDQI